MISIMLHLHVIAMSKYNITSFTIPIMLHYIKCNFCYISITLCYNIISIKIFIATLFLLHYIMIYAIMYLLCIFKL